MVDNAFEFVALCDRDGRLVDMSHNVPKSCGISTESVMGKMFWDVDVWQNENNRSLIMQAYHHATQTKDVQTIHLKYNISDNGVLYVMLRIKPVVRKDTIVNYIIVAREETGYVIKEQHLTAVNTITQILLENTDIEANIHKIIEAIFKIFNVDRAWLLHPVTTVVGSSYHIPVETTSIDYPGALAQGVDVQVDQATSEMFAKVLNSNEPCDFYQSVPGDLPDPIGKDFGVKSQLIYTIAPVVGDTWMVGLHQCSYERRWTQQEKDLMKEISNRVLLMLNIWLLYKNMQHLAYYDPMTDLPNRTHFQHHVQSIFERAKQTNSRFAYFLIDIDDFKRINDSFGHKAGDDFLKEVASRLTTAVDRRCSLEADCKCFVARLGGDEFVLVIEKIFDADQAREIVEDVFSSIKLPFEIDGNLIYATISVGIALYPFDGSSTSALLKAADVALYAAKNRGKNTYSFHDMELNTQLQEYIQYENAIRYFIETGDFDLAYQPIIEVASKMVSGVEVLFRANKRKYPTLTLCKILRIAEEDGLIVDLGKQILKKACMTAKQWIEKYPPFKLSVNISIRQLNDENILTDVFNILNTIQYPYHNLIFEITETIFMQNFAENVHKLTELRSRGIGVSIDDFGTGYSSMTYIKQLPVDKLKIDMSFIKDIAVDKKAEEIVKAIILMANTLGIKSCAEGVETFEQLNMLKKMQCDSVQGYLCSPPQPPNEIIERIGAQCPMLIKSEQIG